MDNKSKGSFFINMAKQALNSTSNVFDKSHKCPIMVGYNFNAVQSLDLFKKNIIYLNIFYRKIQNFISMMQLQMMLNFLQSYHRVI